MYIGNKSYQRQVFKMLWDNASTLLDAGKTVDVTVAEHKAKRTNQQNAYYWLFNGELAKFLDEAGLSYGEYKLPYTGGVSPRNQQEPVRCSYHYQNEKGRVLRIHDKVNVILGRKNSRTVYYE